MTWPPVLLNCPGTDAEPPGLYYRGIGGSIQIVGSILDADGYQQPVYGLAPEAEAFRTTETSSPYLLPDPLPGEVSYVHIEATDAAGNRSEDCQ
jgi:hypothetical protein